MSPGLPHHRQRIEERRTDPEDANAIRAGVAVGFVLGLLMVIAAVAYVARVACSTFATATPASRTTPTTSAHGPQGRNWPGRTLPPPSRTIAAWMRF